MIISIGRASGLGRLLFYIKRGLVGLLLWGVAIVPAVNGQPLPESIWPLLNQAEGILTASPKGHDIQVVFDPNCPYSAVHYQKIRSAFSNLAMRWVPVAYYKDDSDVLAASLLAAKNPSAALARNFQGYDIKNHHGAWPVSDVVSELSIYQKKLQKDWEEWAGATPVTLVRNSNGQVKMFFGTIHSAQREAEFKRFLQENGYN